MTDAESIRALEYCINTQLCAVDTPNCPFEDVSMCRSVLTKKAYDLIKRQQAEIESLKEHEENISIVCKRAEEKYHELYKEAKEMLKRNTIREFAEKLKEKFEIADVVVTIDSKDIDNLVKEMTGGEEVE